MRKGHLITMPPGSGKTKVVLNRVIRLTGGNKISALNNLLVIGPNPKVEKIWLREMALLVIGKRKIKPDDIRKMNLKTLIKNLKEYKVRLHFKTYYQIKKTSNFKSYPFVILDEWHRFNVFSKCTKFIEQFGDPHILSKLVKGRYGNHTFFVSATPLNPVLETEIDAMTEKHVEDEEIITESRKKALYTIAGILGNRIDSEIVQDCFAMAIKKMKISWKRKKTGWEKPQMPPICFTEEINRKFFEIEIEYLAKLSGDDINTPSINEEAAWALGLIRTRSFTKGKSQFKIINNNKGRIKTSFGIKYVSPFVVYSRNNLDAGKWLIENHTRVNRLVEILLKENIINYDGLKYYLSGRGKKILIFCTHQGVALGLEYALRQLIVKGKQENIACAVHEFDESMENNFNQKGSFPFILIATDKMSESIDLHKACNIIVHYELPWSPLRLLQRVGRLTRFLEKGDFNKAFVYHIIIPGSVEEERVNRLLRRTKLLAKEGAWPKELFNGIETNSAKIARSLIGHGPSLQLKE